MSGCTAFLRDSCWGVPQGKPMLCGAAPADACHTEHDRCPGNGLPADHPPVIACHEYAPAPSEAKEKPMLKPVKVHVGTVSDVCMSVDPVSHITSAEVTLRIEGIPDPERIAALLGRPAVLYDLLGEGMPDPERLILSPEAEAVVAAAEEWYDKMYAQYDGRLGAARGTWVEPIFHAVKAYREGR